MNYYVDKNLKKVLEKESEKYSHRVLDLFDSYVRNQRDLLEVDNSSVIFELLNDLESNLEYFIKEVPLNVRRRKNISELEKNVIELFEEYIFTI